MPPAARVTDMHVCPMVTGLVPHVGGPILHPGVPTVLIDFLPAAAVTDMATCVGLVEDRQMTEGALPDYLEKQKKFIVHCLRNFAMRTV
jgi:uncharacterized Zn-binding protein involved in type VI secretion